MLDKIHDGCFEVVPDDDYICIGGEINGYNVVIATRQAGQSYDVAPAVTLIDQARTHFPNIWFALLVGVAAGLPNLSHTELGKRRDN